MYDHFIENIEKGCLYYSKFKIGWVAAYLRRAIITLNEVIDLILVFHCVCVSIGSITRCVL